MRHLGVNLTNTQLKSAAKNKTGTMSSESRKRIYFIYFE